MFNNSLLKMLFKLLWRVVLVSFILHSSACTRLPHVPSEQERKTYRQAVTPIVLWLERKYITNGFYPLFLPAALNVKLEEIDPPGKYEPYNMSASYDIRIGDYRLFGWAYIYDSRSQNWVLDQ